MSSAGEAVAKVRAPANPVGLVHALCTKWGVVGVERQLMLALAFGTQSLLLEWLLHPALTLGPVGHSAMFSNYIPVRSHYLHPIASAVRPDNDARLN